MKILMVVAYFPPEIGSAAHVYHDLASAFVRNDHEVTVLTSYPREFNLNKSDQGKVFPNSEIINGINVRRSKIFSMRDFAFLRGLEHFFLPYSYFNEYKKMGEKFDVCLMYIPPLPLYQLANKIRKYDGTPSVLNYQDFHPQELLDVNYGGIKNNIIMIKLLEHMERKSYRDADYITVLSEGGIDYVVNKGADPSKVTHIYNGINPSDVHHFESKRDFKKNEGIEDKILISYAGILSPFQGIDNILNVAKELKDHDDVIFYIAGDGMIKDNLEERIKNEDISNLKLIPFQPREEYFNIVNSSDISIVSLDDRMLAPCLPGKLTNLLALKQPIIGIVSRKSETASFIKNVNCGNLVEPGDVDGFKNAILELKDNPMIREKFGENGRRFIENEMNLEKNVSIYKDIFYELKKGK
ncbi:MAG: glycosyltransferase [Methanobacterium sp. Maddingley MBC34]|nr:MAG: glycosyltransferase [Methanobacterium sp. Maddingley MBC34]